MSKKGIEIKKLLATSRAAAPDITKPLKSIGDGNMLTGLKNIYNYAFSDGERKGVLKGSIGTIAVLGGVCLVADGIKTIKKRENVKSHKKMGDKIFNALNEELIEAPQEVTNDEETVRTEE